MLQHANQDKRHAEACPTGWAMNGNRSGITLGLCTILHALTHALGSMLVPLYLLMRDDLRRGGVKEIALIVTGYGVGYAVLSYPAGILAGRMSREVLAGGGLRGNAAAVFLG